MKIQENIIGHTPGPWAAGDAQFFEDENPIVDINVPALNHTAFIQVCGRIPTEKVKGRNAFDLMLDRLHADVALVAAAPAMREALVVVDNWFAQLEAIAKLGPGDAEVARTVRAALTLSRAEVLHDGDGKLLRRRSPITPGCEECAGCPDCLEYPKAAR